jgi:hypothetical protein
MVAALALRISEIVMKVRICLIAWCLILVLPGTAERVWANIMVPFLEAASGADAVVLARFADSDASHLRFSIVDTYRGKVSAEFVKVPKNLWPYVSQRFPDEGLKSAQFLLLVNADGSLTCGHLGDMVILCGTCLGVIPIVDGAVPEAYRWSLNRRGVGVISLEQVKAVLVGKRGRG